MPQRKSIGVSFLFPLANPRLGERNQEFRPPRSLCCPVSADLLVVWMAHCHSGSQSLRHLPWHSYSIMLPPHCGHTKLMIEEIMLGLGSPGSVSNVLMLCLLSSCRTLLNEKEFQVASMRGAAEDRIRRQLAADVKTLPKRSALVCYGVRPGPLYRPPPRSLQDIATAMPNAKPETRLLNGWGLPYTYSCGSCQLPNPVS